MWRSTAALLVEIGDAQNQARGCAFLNQCRGQVSHSSRALALRARFSSSRSDTRRTFSAGRRWSITADIPSNHRAPVRTTQGSCGEASQGVFTLQPCSCGEHYHGEWMVQQARGLKLTGEQNLATRATTIFWLHLGEAHMCRSPPQS